MRYKVDISKCIDDAVSKLKIFDKQLLHEDCDVYSWPQTWPNTCCGFHGIGGQAITSAQTVVVIGPHFDACVYHAGRFAYYIDNTSEEFYKCLHNLKMPGAREGREINKLRKKSE